MRDLHDDVARGARAEHELRETEAAFDAVKAAIVKELVGTPPGQPDKILKLHQAAQIVGQVRDALHKTMTAGRHAEATLSARDALAETGLTQP